MAPVKMGPTMQSRARVDADRPLHDLVLLASLLFLILLHPLLSQSDLRRLLMGMMCLVPVIVATFRIAGHKRLVAVLVTLMVAGFGVAALAELLHSPFWATVQWILLTLAFGIVAGTLFRHLQRAHSISSGHLLTAASIYLLLAVFFFGIYATVQVRHPEAFRETVISPDHHPDLLYFSLATLTTLGYGDIVPVGPEVRTIAALEAAAGVLYVAITVALLVGRVRANHL